MTTDPHDLNDLSKIGIRGYFERILQERDRRDAERDRRLDERFEAQEKAVTSALAAAEKATNAALAASDKAVQKSEEAQLRVNVTQNEFRGTLADQATLQMPRLEAENTFRELRNQTADVKVLLDELRSRVDVGPPSLAALQAQSDLGRGRTSGVQTTATTLIAGVVALVAVLAFLAAHYH